MIYLCFHFKTETTIALNPQEKNALLALRAALQAGHAVMQVYRDSFFVTRKADGSPITEADRQSEKIILSHLTSSGLPVISEETPVASMSIRKQWEYFWLVDPLDGTKEFVNQNGEFTINIALIYKGHPILGILTAPALNMGYLGITGIGAWRISCLQTLETNWSDNLEEISSHMIPLGPTPPPVDPTLAVSRSHTDQGNALMIDTFLEKGKPYHTLSRGSALKFGLVAEGAAHFYMRNDKIWEWDTAAGHAVLLAAGGYLLCWPSGQELVYNKEDLRNPAFVACSSRKDLEALRSKFPLQEGI